MSCWIMTTTGPLTSLLTEAKRSAVKLADSFTLNPGSIAASGSRLCPIWSLDPARVYFGTRLKDNASFLVDGECR